MGQRAMTPCRRGRQRGAHPTHPDVKRALNPAIDGVPSVIATGNHDRDGDPDPHHDVMGARGEGSVPWIIGAHVLPLRLLFLCM